MTARHAFTLALTLRSPFLLRGLAAGATGVDTPQLRDERGSPIIPADQVRGVVREAMVDLAEVGAIETKMIADLFGSPSAERGEIAGETDSPIRGRLIFGDLVAEKMSGSKAGDEQQLPEAGAADTTRVMIDDETGTASTGSLQVIELVAPFGALVRFSGRLVVFAPEAEAEAIRKRLSQALALVTSIGAIKSAGYGEVAKVELVGEGSPRPLALPASQSGPMRGLYRVSFDRPVLVDSEKVADNAFWGASVIPGAVFKAALARRVELSGDDPTSGEIGDALTALSFSHAMPESDVDGQALLMPIPFSMVAVNKEGLKFGDASDIAMGTGPLLDGEAAAFQPDWKDSWRTAAAAFLGHPSGKEPPSIARTHTAIRDGVADESKLFTTIARAAHRGGDKSSLFTWLLTVDGSACPDQQIAGRLLAALSQGLDGIGKTDAHARVERIGDASVPAPRAVAGNPRRHIVVLASDALLVDPVASTTRDGGAWSISAHEAYAAYWQKTLPGATLVNAFTKERWAGAYLSFRRRPYGGRSYHPFLVTTAGSTFVIDDADPGRLRTLCNKGLPLPELSQAEKLDWRNCPFVPENGYGRIGADHCSDPEMARLLTEVTGA